jgi:salicylate hydroxylase
MQIKQDAYILASVLTAGVQDGLDVARIAEVYSTVRQPMGNFVLNNSRKQGFRYELNAAGWEDVQEHEPVEIDRMVSLAEEIVRAWRWVWMTSVLEDQKRALSLL